MLSSGLRAALRSEMPDALRRARTAPNQHGGLASRGVKRSRHADHGRSESARRLCRTGRLSPWESTGDPTGHRSVATAALSGMPSRFTKRDARRPSSAADSAGANGIPTGGPRALRAGNRFPTRHPDATRRVAADSWPHPLRGTKRQ